MRTAYWFFGAAGVLSALALLLQVNLFLWLGLAALVVGSLLKSEDGGGSGDGDGGD